MDNFEKIEQYYLNEFNENDRILFENELDNDSQLKKEYSAYLLAIDGFKYNKPRSLVNKIQEEHLNKQTKNIGFRPYLTKIAASIAILMLSIGAYYSFTLNNSSLVDSSYLIPQMRSTEQVEAQINNFYKNKDYNKVIETFNSEKDPNFDEKFIAAMAFFNTKQFEASINLLSELSKYNSSKYSNEIEYYTLLNEIGLEDYDRAIQLAIILQSKSENPYSQRISKTFLVKLKILSLKK